MFLTTIFRTATNSGLLWTKIRGEWIPYDWLSLAFSINDKRFVKVRSVWRLLVISHCSYSLVNIMTAVGSFATAASASACVPALISFGMANFFPVNPAVQ